MCATAISTEKTISINTRNIFLDNDLTIIIKNNAFAVKTVINNNDFEKSQNDIENDYLTYTLLAKGNYFYGLVPKITGLVDTGSILSSSVCTSITSGNSAGYCSCSAKSLYFY